MTHEAAVWRCRLAMGKDILMATQGENTAHQEVGAEAPPLLTQKFLGCITDWVFALFVFLLVFRLPSLGLYRWANNVDAARFRVALQVGGVLVIILGSLWCVAFALQSAAGFLKYLLQTSD